MTKLNFYDKIGESIQIVYNKNTMKKQDFIYTTLKDEIISGVLPSDMPLREIDLANRFEVSRTPIREVLHQLAVEKLIRIIPNSGAFVGAFTWEDATEVFEVRQGLEVFAAGLAASRISSESIEKLEELYTEMKRLVEDNDGEKYAKADEAFHEIINQSSGNNFLIEMIHSVNDRAKLSKLRRYSYQHGTMSISLKGHREIIDLLRLHDSENAAKKMGEHGRALFNDLPITT